MDDVNRRSAAAKTRPLCLLLSGLLLCSCTSLRDSVPAWVQNPQFIYPESDYLVAVGEGDTRRAAENAAAANLSRIFEARIESDERLIDQVRETDRSLERTVDFSTDINVLSAQTLYNIRHAEAWTDDNGRVHAIAYLDRRRTAALYREKMDEEQKQVDLLRARAAESADPLTAYALLRTAVRHADEAADLLNQLNIIHPPAAAGSSAGYDAYALRRALAKTAQQIRVEIHMDGDLDGRIASTLEHLITGYGFVIGTPFTLKIEGRIAIEDTGQRTADLAFVRYELLVQIKDHAGGILSSISEKGREGHISVQEARVRSFRTLESALDSRCTKQLNDYFDSLVNHGRLP